MGTRRRREEAETVEEVGVPNQNFTVKVGSGGREVRRTQRAASSAEPERRRRQRPARSVRRSARSVEPERRRRRRPARSVEPERQRRRPARSVERERRRRRAKEEPQRRRERDRDVRKRTGRKRRREPEPEPEPEPEVEESGLASESDSSASSEEEDDVGTESPPGSPVAPAPAPTPRIFHKRVREGEPVQQQPQPRGTVVSEQPQPQPRGTVVSEQLPAGAGPRRGEAVLAHPAGLWCAHDIVPPEDCEVLIRSMAVRLEARGQRQLRWFGGNWQGYGDITPTDPIPPGQCRQIVDRLCAKVGFPHANVATLHVYHRQRAKQASGDDAGQQNAGRLMAIKPHTDDAKLEGEGGVLMVQLSGTAELVLSTRGRCVATAVRRQGTGCICDDEAFRSPYQHCVLWPRERAGDEMVTLTLRSLPLLGEAAPKRRRVERSASPPMPELTAAEMRQAEFETKKKKYADFKKRFADTYGRQATLTDLTSDARWKPQYDLYQRLLELRKECAGGSRAAPAPTPPAEPSLQQLRAEHKEKVEVYQNWLRTFRAQHGRPPKKSDLQDEAIAATYARVTELTAMPGLLLPAPKPASAPTAVRAPAPAAAPAPAPAAAGSNPFMSAPSAPKRRAAPQPAVGGDDDDGSSCPSFE
eukprot:TRINITY_DN8323_c3_g1_i1.p1 TRINITY_DN8323_c3_g1~~TRINITY_DN8323_c3_g1_i1.p1  ORF type:complete len:643 (+),score=228.78 TRINITY_DN8323_c3_g1_i1:77-2005(+)